MLEAWIVGYQVLLFCLQPYQLYLILGLCLVWMGVCLCWKCFVNWGNGWVNKYLLRPEFCSSQHSLGLASKLSIYHKKMRTKTDGRHKNNTFLLYFVKFIIFRSKSKLMREKKRRGWAVPGSAQAEVSQTSQVYCSVVGSQPTLPPSY